MTIGKAWPAFLKVLNEYVSSGVCERKNKLLSRLTLRDPYCAGTPIDVIQGKRNHLAGSKAVCGNKEKHCVITQTMRIRRVDGTEKLSYGFPWEMARQPLQAIDPWSVDHGVQRVVQNGFFILKTQESPQIPDHMLERIAVQPF
jgi:hypothetical protein